MRTSPSAHGPKLLQLDRNYYLSSTFSSLRCTELLCSMYWTYTLAHAEICVVSSHDGGRSVNRSMAWDLTANGRPADQLRHCQELHVDDPIAIWVKGDAPELQGPKVDGVLSRSSLSLGRRRAAANGETVLHQSFTGNKAKLACNFPAGARWGKRGVLVLGQEQENVRTQEFGDALQGPKGCKLLHGPVQQAAWRRHVPQHGGDH